MERALATVELLELILLHVDARTVLTSAARACRLWRDVIRGSPRLQALLFFRPERPATAGRGPPGDLDGTEAPRTNPLLLRRFEALLDGTADAGTEDGRALLRPEASWRAMLVQQPPARTVGVWRVEKGCHLAQGFENETEILDFAGEGGVRMGRLAEYVGSLGPGYASSAPWGEEPGQRLERGRSSLFFRKARMSDRRSLVHMWRNSDMVISLTRWSGAR